METIEVVIETPKGSPLKYAYEPDTHFFRLKKILPLGMAFPYDFGFIPGTKGEDGDPLDIIVLSEFASFPGCKMDCRFIGGLQAEQSEKSGSDRMIRNDRFLAVPVQSQVFEKTQSIDDLPETLLTQLEEFFTGYNNIEGKRFRVLGRIYAMPEKT